MAHSRHVLQVYVGQLSPQYEALSIEVSKHTSCLEIVTCIVQQLQLTEPSHYELAEVIGNAGGQDCKVRHLCPHETPVALQLLWPQSSVTDNPEDFEKHEYRFCLREKSSSDQLDSQLIRDYFNKFLYQPKDKEYPDLCQLTNLNELSLLENLRARFQRGHIYTYVGSILISVNPFNYYPIYNPKYVKLYQNHRLGELPPHIFAIADASYHSMLKQRKNQCIVISGESGSGKTEATLFLLHHLTMLSQKGSHGSGVEQTILSSGPVLEAFGNAKTAHNNNSSRFGKFIQVSYKENGLVQGACVQKYLLEKSRICSQAYNERSYHVFYYLLAGASNQERQTLNLLKPSDYRYLSQSNCFTIDGNFEQYEFVRLKQSMEMVGFTPDKQHRLFAVLSAVLLIGNLEFSPKKSTYHHDESVVVRNWALASTIASLLGVSEDTLVNAITSKKAKVHGEVLVINYRLPEALAARDALAKCLYGALFDWIVLQVNYSLISLKEQSTEQNGNSIGVLDIFGFEDFGNHNRFEQFCINYANEHLQHYFNQHVFEYEQEEYRRESISWTNIGFKDNVFCLALIEGKPNGLLCILDDQCSFPGATNETFLQKINSVHKDNEYYEIPQKREEAFIIKHYAGKVKYQVEDIREKNLDLMRPELISVLKNSRFSVVRELAGADPVAVFRWAILRAFFRGVSAFNVALNRSRKRDATDQRKLKQKVSVDNTRILAAIENTQNRLRKTRHNRSRSRSHGLRNQKNLRSVKALAQRTQTLTSQGRLPGSRKSPHTVTGQFQMSLQALMEALNQANPYFIRCIKSNARKEANFFDDELVQRQLRYTGMLETVRIRQASFNVRMMFDEFIQHYRILLPKGLLSSQSDVERFLDTMPLERSAYQVGKTKVFMRESQKTKLDTVLHQTILSRIILIQRWYRATQQRRSFLTLRGAVIRIQSQVRCWLAQQLAANIRMQHQAATCIQRMWRGYKVRSWYTSVRVTLIRIQARARGKLARERYSSLLEEERRSEQRLRLRRRRRKEEEEEEGAQVPPPAPAAAAAAATPTTSSPSQRPPSPSYSSRTTTTTGPRRRSNTPSLDALGNPSPSSEVTLRHPLRHETPSATQQVVPPRRRSAAAQKKMDRQLSTPPCPSSPPPEEEDPVLQRLSSSESTPPPVAAQRGHALPSRRMSETAVSLTKRHAPLQTRRSEEVLCSYTPPASPGGQRWAGADRSEVDGTRPPLKTRSFRHRHYQKVPEGSEFERSETDRSLDPTASDEDKLSSSASSTVIFPKIKKHLKSFIGKREGSISESDDNSNESSDPHTPTSLADEPGGGGGGEPPFSPWPPSQNQTHPSAPSNRVSAPTAGDSKYPQGRAKDARASAKGKEGRLSEPIRVDSYKEPSPPPSSYEGLLHPLQQTGLLKGEDLKTLLSDSPHNLKQSQLKKGGMCSSCDKPFNKFFVNQGFKCTTCKKLFHSGCMKSSMSVSCLFLNGSSYSSSGAPGSGGQPSSSGGKENASPALKKFRTRLLEDRNWNLTGTSQFIDRSDEVIKDAYELKALEEFITKKIYNLDSEHGSEGLCGPGLPSSGETDGGCGRERKDSVVDKLFCKSLKAFKGYLVSAYSVSSQNDEMDVNVILKYKDLIKNFEQEMTNLCKADPAGRTEAFPVTMGVNAFRGFLDEFIRDKRPEDKVVKKRKRHRRKKKEKKVEEINFGLHKFIHIFVNIYTQCEVCNSILWLSSKALSCQKCKLTCHQKCLDRVEKTICSNHSSSTKVVVVALDRPRRRGDGSGGGRGAKRASNLLVVPHRGKVFGAPLESLVGPDEKIPAVVEKIFSSVELHGIYTEGLYRKSGASSKVRELKSSIDSDPDPVKAKFEDVPIHVLTAILKSYLRELPEPLLTFEAYEPLLRTSALEDPNDVFENTLSIIHKLPKAHFDLLERLIFHLALVARNEAYNRMTCSSLAIVFSPCILRSPRSVPVQDSLNDISKQTVVIELLISRQLCKVFDVMRDIENVDKESIMAAAKLNSLKTSKLRSVGAGVSGSAPGGDCAPSAGAAPRLDPREALAVYKLEEQLHDFEEQKSRLTFGLPELVRASSEEDLLSTDMSHAGSLEDVASASASSARSVFAPSYSLDDTDGVDSCSSSSGAPVAWRRFRRGNAVSEGDDKSVTSNSSAASKGTTPQGEAGGGGHDYAPEDAVMV